VRPIPGSKIAGTENLFAVKSTQPLPKDDDQICLP
jgi:hypothetical protein